MLGHWYREYGEMVFRRCVRILRDDEEAMDVVHEVFVRLLDAEGSYQDRGKALNYLYTVATRLSLNRLRDRAVRSGHEVPVALPVMTVGTEDELESRSLTRALLERWDERTALVAYLVFFDGMTQGEVASTLGISRRTVVTVLTKVRREAKELRDG